MICNKCGAQIRDESVFCSKCGFAVTKDIPESNMICNSCGAQIHGNSVFCSKCGAAAAPDTFIQNSNNVISELPAAREKTQGRKKRKIIALICAAVIVVGFFVSVIIIETIRTDRYNKAVSVMASDPLGAKAEFLTLGKYRDCETLAQDCQNASDYKDACAAMDRHEYAEAETKFISLGSYNDSTDKALECRNNIDYNAAKTMMDSGNYQGAYNSFSALGEYSDSSAKALECKSQLAYDKAVSLIGEGKYSEAYDAFTALGNFKDSKNLSKDCGYKLAGQYFSDKKFYSAQKLYLSLGNYLDSAALAKKCPQKVPKTGQHHRSSDLEDYGCDVLKIKAPKDGFYTYIKVYSDKLVEDNTKLESKLVDTVFLASGKSTKIKLPGGKTYTFKMGYGKAWYGEKEMFGSDGKYILMQFKQNGMSTAIIYFDVALDFYPYESSYTIYTFKLRQKEFSDGMNISLEDFLSDDNLDNLIKGK